ncbi:MAG: MaoC family dehydratase [Deltaproteobacteria bacterium]|jgi:acyl dehydratase|nr:MaoC family dehydratase [Deltaproteobacteria bacterium]
MTAAEQLIVLYQKRIGQEIDRGEWCVIDQERINAFARVTRDEQWIHTDPDKARRDSPYRATIAHGFLTLSLLPFLTKGNQPDYLAKNFPGMRLRINYGLNKVRFPAPVKAGSSVRARTIVSAIEAVNDGVQVVLTQIVDIAGETKPACVAEQVVRLHP